MSTDEQASAAIEAAWEQGYETGQQSVMIGWKWTPIEGAEKFKVIMAVTDNLNADFTKMIAEHIVEEILAKDGQEPNLGR